jgi:hypothetical protein
MERLDRVEEGLKRLGRGEDEDEEEEVLFEEPEDEEAENTPLMKEPVTAPAVIVPAPLSQPQASTSTSTAGSTLVNGDAEGSTAGTRPRLSGLGAAAVSRPSVRMSEDGGSKSMHVRWASHGGHEGRSGRSMDVSRTPVPMGMEGTGSGTKTVISEVSILCSTQK